MSRERMPSPPVRPSEAALVALALAAAWHFLALRARAAGLPGGDEGSWLSVAAELSRGHGFTTRWLEAHFLKPYALPRPDDFRYPALTSLLAIAFRIFGMSIGIARATVTCVFLGFAILLWRAARTASGPWAGLAALWLTCCSLLQAEWNSLVYTEGLFGLATALLVLWCQRLEGPADEEKPARLRLWRAGTWWAGLGAGVGLLYLVRANGILFLAGVPWLWWLRRRTVSPLYPLLAFAAFALVAGPWMIRSAVHFGSPFHVAGSAGMLREVGQPHTFTVAEYFSHYDALFPLRRMGEGLWHFFRDLHFFEHGLEIVPLVLAAVAALRRKRFFHPFLVPGFVLTFLASAYAAYDSWAGVRYMTGLLPFVYAYGLGLPSRKLAAVPPQHGAAAGSTQATNRASMETASSQRGAAIGRSVARTEFIGVILVAILLLPVLGPIRFYERKFAHPADIGPALSAHLALLRSRIPEGGRYYAASLCKVNFLAPDRDCVGLQELYDSTWFDRSMAAFHPGWVALTREEMRDSTLQAALERMRRGGYTPVTLDEEPLGTLFALQAQARGPQ